MPLGYTAGTWAQRRRAEEASREPTKEGRWVCLIRRYGLQRDTLPIALAQCTMDPTAGATGSGPTSAVRSGEDDKRAPSGRCGMAWGVERSTAIGQQGGDRGLVLIQHVWVCGTDASLRCLLVRGVPPSVPGIGRLGARGGRKMASLNPCLKGLEPWDSTPRFFHGGEWRQSPRGLPVIEEKAVASVMSVVSWHPLLQRGRFVDTLRPPQCHPRRGPSAIMAHCRGYGSSVGIHALHAACSTHRSCLRRGLAFSILRWTKTY